MTDSTGKNSFLLLKIYLNFKNLQLFLKFRTSSGVQKGINPLRKTVVTYVRSKHEWLKEAFSDSLSSPNTSHKVFHE